MEKPMQQVITYQEALAERRIIIIIIMDTEQYPSAAAMRLISR
jgi:hypothetical protein